MTAHRYGDGFDPFLEPWSPDWCPLLAAAARATDPTAPLEALIGRLGFDGMTCIVLARAPGGDERAISMWSTSGAAWDARYRGSRYADVDPRVTMTAPRLSPVVWDAADGDRDPSLQRFLDDAARFGVRSGFAVSFRDASQLRVVVAFDSSSSPLSDARCSGVMSRLGDLMLLAAGLHDRVLRPRLGGITRSTPYGLTLRESDCLRMAAQGLTSADIGGKLGIAERTVNFHMRNVLRKLEAANRAEAIAKALARGVFETSALAQRSA